MIRDLPSASLRWIVFDDALQVVSDLWALAAALISHRTARIFLVIFGALHLVDGVFGFFTGYGYLDIGIFTNPSAGMSFTLVRVFANLPHENAFPVVPETGTSAGAFCRRAASARWAISLSAVTGALALATSPDLRHVTPNPS